MLWREDRQTLYIYRTWDFKKALHDNSSLKQILDITNTDRTPTIVSSLGVLGGEREDQMSGQGLGTGDVGNVHETQDLQTGAHLLMDLLKLLHPASEQTLNHLAP